MCFKASPHIPLVKGSHMAKPALGGQEVHSSHKEGTQEKPREDRPSGEGQHSAWKLKALVNDL